MMDGPDMDQNHGMTEGPVQRTPRGAAGHTEAAARGGKNSAQQQTRDQYGQFAGKTTRVQPGAAVPGRSASQDTVRTPGMQDVHQPGRDEIEHGRGPTLD